MALNVNEENLEHGVLTLVEVIQEALESQAVRRMEGGDITEDEQNRLGEASVADVSVGDDRSRSGADTDSSAAEAPTKPHGKRP